MNMQKPIYKPTIILFEGVIYKLVKADFHDTNYPCEMCDLAALCRDNYLLSLCKPEGYDTSWYFSESWDDANKTLIDLVADIH